MIASMNLSADALGFLQSILPETPRTRYTANGDGLYVPSPWETMLESLEAAEIRGGERFLDIGSGDGRVAAAAALLGASAAGYEIDPDLHQTAVRLSQILSERFPFAALDLRLGNVFGAEFGSADILFYYAGGCANRQKLLYDRLAREIHSDGRLIILRTQRLPDIALELSPLSRPPYFYLFKRSLDSYRIRV